MKTNISKFSILFVIFLLIIFKNISFSQGTYFHDADFVYLTVNELTNPIPALGEKRTLYWDLSNIDTTNNFNRLDLCVGQNQIYLGSLNDYLIGNWFRNEINSNFNNENPNLRFINNTLPQIVDSITGLAFISLRENAKRDLVVLRSSGEMEIRNNQSSFIQIINPTIIQGVFGNTPVAGKFTTDTLEDLALISLSPLGVRIFKGTGGINPTLEQNYTLSLSSLKKVYLAQINKHIGPLAVIYNGTNDRDEIVVQNGNCILIFKNNNNNTTPSNPETTLCFSDFLSDFKVADVNNDGYNDIIAITQYDIDFSTYGEVSIFLNNNGTISNTPIYSNDGISYVYSLAVADFNKDGWNDLIIDIGLDTIALFLNNKTTGLFSNIPTESFRFEEAPGPLLIPPIFARKIVATDLYNNGGIGVILSGWPGVDPGFQYETMIRINATTSDAVPAPAYLFSEYSNVDPPNIVHPQLILFNRGDRDFLQYKIYKKRAAYDFYYVLIDSTTDEYYIDSTEKIYYSGECNPEPPLDLCSYYVKSEDMSKQLSVNSDTIYYETRDHLYYCEDGNPSIATNEQFKNEFPKEYSLNNYPNPFNPTTNLEFGIPKSGFVSLKIFDIRGKEVATIVNENLNPRTYKYKFDGSNFSSGMYFYRLVVSSSSDAGSSNPLESNGIVMTRRMLLIK